MNAMPFAAPLEALLNRNIESSPRAQALAKKLDGRALRLQIAGTPLEFSLAVQDGRVHLAAGDRPADATLAGSPLGLAALGLPGGEDRLRGGALTISGDAEVAQAFRDLFAAAKPDLEEELARFLGDATAHHVGRTMRGVLDYGTRALDTLAMNVSEYLTEESRDVPTRDEVGLFVADVDRLREDADRLAARVALLESRSRRP
jgi:ubiquinone biosynthesis protein UbiJ